MRHHRVVDQHDPHALAVVEAQGLRVGELHPVERPGETLHVAGQVQLDRAARRASVRVAERAAQVGVGQHAAAVVAQPDAGVIQPGRGRHRLHVDQGIAGFGGRVFLHPAGAVVHAGHARTGGRTSGHRRHVVAAVIHAGHRTV